MTTSLITPDYVRLMAAYNSEMNRRLYAAADRLTPAQRTEPRGAFFGSVQGTLSHLLWGDRTWMHRFDGWEKPEGGIRTSPGLYPDWDALKAARLAADAAIEDWAARLDPAWLQGDLGWFSAALGRDVTRPRAVLVVHFFNHQTHHRGQVHALLTGFGEQTGDTDLPFILPFD
ncbi:DinB family protein [Falsiroseomonas oryziterrae]|uniref:DinB family protein n=1 Tax=Falsiroseomonas oryziterrae TaxID=2911368 RepID=UPI001F31C655|nr:DinB family protein [Roseomonas sp. NPKOSM-4]